MIYRTLAEAQREPTFASWKQLVITGVTLSDGRTFYRTYQFDSSRDCCKRCRNSRRTGGHGDHRRLNSTRRGERCESCGNPYIGFIRQHRRKIDKNRFETIHQSWSGSGRAH